ncbi:MAG: geranylgeranylglyceryl phosphate synthase family protein [Crocinitomicaceae bacterium]|nr:geranylgeranylglyceryl phosphate synthase family protein [Crocinitomicaceae bacterium]
MLKSTEIFNQLTSKKGQIAILIDPDKTNNNGYLANLLKKAQFANVNYFFVGGSTVSREDFESCISYIKENSSIPVVIFPGASHQISEKADAILYLSLISGRNPDYLIGHHVQSAKELFEMEIEVIPTAYILIDGGTNSAVAYVSQTTPIPPDKKSIIVNTAKAGLLQGKKILYLDAGSGAKNAISSEITSSLSTLGAPIIIGGGIRSIEQIENASNANVIVIGNKLEEDINFLLDIKSFIEQSV